MIDPQVLTTVGTMIAGLLTALGAAAFGFRKLTAANAKLLQERNEELEKELDKEQARTLAERARTEEARHETEQVRLEKEAMRVDMARQIEEERAGRRADRLQHEADMQQRTRELGGAPS